MWHTCLLRRWIICGGGSEGPTIPIKIVNNLLLDWPCCLQVFSRKILIFMILNVQLSTPWRLTKEWTSGWPGKNFQKISEFLLLICATSDYRGDGMCQNCGSFWVTTELKLVPMNCKDRLLHFLITLEILLLSWASIHPTFKSKSCLPNTDISIILTTKLKTSLKINPVLLSKVSKMESQLWWRERVNNILMGLLLSMRSLVEVIQDLNIEK